MALCKTKTSFLMRSIVAIRFALIARTTIPKFCDREGDDGSSSGRGLCLRHARTRKERAYPNKKEEYTVHMVIQKD
jgi:hypothetical protein